MSATPLARSRSTITNSLSTSVCVSAVVGSSMISTRASLTSARQIAVSCLSATEQLLHVRVEVKIQAEVVNDGLGAGRRCRALWKLDGGRLLPRSGRCSRRR